LTNNEQKLTQNIEQPLEQEPLHTLAKTEQFWYCLIWKRAVI